MILEIFMERKMKNFTVKPLAAAIGSIGLATALAGAPVAWAEEENAEEIIEEVLVTGSRIARTGNTAWIYAVKTALRRSF